jgi:putative peptidoglycan lipid II flippase
VTDEPPASAGYAQPDDSAPPGRYYDDRGAAAPPSGYADDYSGAVPDDGRRDAWPEAEPAYGTPGYRVGEPSSGQDQDYYDSLYRPGDRGRRLDDDDLDFFDDDQWQVTGYHTFGLGPGYSDFDTGYIPQLTWQRDEAGGSARTATGVAEPARARETGTFAVVRSSGVMAVGTLASRVTGMLRTLVQAYALGEAALANGYNVANTLPNAVYYLMLGGILTSVIVPLLVSAAKRDTDRGEAYDQRMFTLITFALLGITLAATLAAEPIAHLFTGSSSGPEEHLTVLFAYFFIPQIFFYGVSSLAGAILNARGSFAAPMWTPVINNVVVIVVLLLFIAVARPGVSPASITGGELQLLGLGTTLGIVAQTVALLPALRRVGFRWRPRFDFRRAEAAEIWQMAGWMFGYVATTEIAVIITTRIAYQVGHLVPTHSYAAYTYAWQLFQMPYAIVGISVITALLPRMSAHAAERRLRLVRGDFSAGIRLSSVIVVPSALVLAALGPALARVFLSYGHTTVADATFTGEVFAVFCLLLVPYMIFQLQLRVFYSLHDSRTPALIGVVTMLVNIGINYAALAILPAGQVVAGLGAGFGLANLAGAIIAWRVLTRRLSGLDGHGIARSLVRMHVAAIPAAIFAIAVSVMIGTAIGSGRLGSLVTVILGGGGALLIYVLFSKAFRVGELTELTAMLGARFRR